VAWLYGSWRARWVVRRRRKYTRAAIRNNAAMTPITMPAMAPPDSDEEEEDDDECAAAPVGVGVDFWGFDDDDNEEVSFVLLGAAVELVVVVPVDTAAAFKSPYGMLHLTSDSLARMLGSQLVSGGQHACVVPLARLVQDTESGLEQTDGWSM
jgi:hypothetical protein